MASLRIFLADDHEVVRRVITALLTFHRGWEICGEAADGREAVEKVAQLKPDIALLDIDMPNMNGLEATRQIVQNTPSQKVIVLTMANTEQVARDVFHAGALGFVLKPNATHDLAVAIEAVHRGQTFFTARFADTILKSYLKGDKENGSTEATLTEPQRETVRLLTEAGEARLPLDTVARAKLVLTDDLIALSQHKSVKPFPPRSATQSRPH